MSQGERLFFPIIPRKFTTVLLLLLFLFLTFNSYSCNARDNSTRNHPSTSLCAPSSCGNITEIRFPFRLKTDPDSCRHKRDNQVSEVELDCLNNRTVMNLTLSKGRCYYVQEINYEEPSFRLVDPNVNINRGNISSCPLHSHVYDSYFFLKDGYGVFHEAQTLLRQAQNTRAVAFIHCLSRVNSTKYVEAPFCGNTSNMFAKSSEFYSYVMLEGKRPKGTRGIDLRVSDLEESCTIDRVVMGPLDMSSNSSWPSIYEGLYIGFKLLLSRRTCFREFHFTFNPTYIVDRLRCCQVSPNRINPHCQDSNLVEGLKIAIYTFWMVVSLVAMRLLIFVVAFPLLNRLVLSKWRRRHLSMDNTIEEFLQANHNFVPIRYNYLEIKEMSNNFAQKLGEGGFGIVYKGKLRSNLYVAIKMMDQSMASEEEFISEVGTIGRIHHINIVQLIGFCVERSKYALVYEFLPNGSLDRYIFNKQSLGVLALTFEKMYEIALGVAHGISYMHHGCNMQILHFDIKPHNILLDEMFNPKISDFGLAQLHPTHESCINLTAARGTFGYMAPEMFYKNFGGISYKADVYSFGMMLMEMVSRRKSMNPLVEDTSQMLFPSCVYDHLCAGKDIEIKDATKEERKIVKKILIVALWCIQMRPSDRPSMRKVVDMLESESELRIPPKLFIAPYDKAANNEFKLVV